MRGVGLILLFAVFTIFLGITSILNFSEKAISEGFAAALAAIITAQFTGKLISRRNNEMQSTDPTTSPQ